MQKSKETDDALLHSEKHLEQVVKQQAEQLQREAHKRRRLSATLLKALWRSEAHRRLSESNIIGVVVMEVGGRLIDANDEFLRMLGYRRGELPLGKILFEDITPRKYRDTDRRALEELRLRGVATPWEKEHLHKGGACVPVLVGAALLEGSEERAVAFVLDLTERKRAEAVAARYAEELQRRNDQLEEDLRMARQIQQAFLPQHFPEISANVSGVHATLRFFHRYYPAGPVGGDFFDVLTLPEGRAGVFICDVMGHGVRAALVTGMMRTLVEQLRPIADDPGKMLGELNAGLIATLRQTGTPLFVSACYLVADTLRGQLSVANAGHPQPLLLKRSRGSVRAIACERGPALGLVEGICYSSATWPLELGDGVLLFTDGIFDIEEPGAPLLTPELLHRAVEERLSLPHDQLLGSLISDVLGPSPRRHFVDDVCLVDMEWCP